MVSDIFSNFVTYETYEKYQKRNIRSSPSYGLLVRSFIVRKQEERKQKHYYHQASNKGKERHTEHERLCAKPCDRMAWQQLYEYYDNRITVRITRKDGSVFFNRTFTKTDFAQYAKGSYGRDGALLGVVFNTIKDDTLLFAASVGSPDNMSDNFVPIVVRISRTGAVSMSEDTAIDTGTDAPIDDDDDEGV